MTDKERIEEARKKAREILSHEEEKCLVFQGRFNILEIHERIAQALTKFNS